MERALEGVKVIDMCTVQAGPSCAQMLGFLGADVIKVEDTRGGDRTRWEMAHNEHDSVYYTIFNNNKRAMTLNLKTERGQEIFTGLVEWADIVFENYSKGVLERLGFTYERLKEIKPDVIYATIKGFGEYGPWSEYRSFETAAQASGGVMAANGYPDGPPMSAPIGGGDSGTGLHMTIGILAALRQRDKTGEGQQVEVSMQDGVVNLMRIGLIRTLATGEPSVRRGVGGLTGIPTVFKCSPGGPDDWAMIHTRGASWETALAVMEREDLIGDERYDNDDKRGERAAEVDAIITEWTSKRTKYDVFHAMAKVGVWCGPVLNANEIVANEHLIERDMIVDVEDSVRGDYRMIGCPVKLEKSPVTVTTAPRFSEHTDSILTEMLGVDADELPKLREQGIIV